MIKSIDFTKFTYNEQSYKVKKVSDTQPNLEPEPEPEPEPAKVLSMEQQQAISLFIQRKNIFITGPGGTGKTHLIKEFIKEADKMKKEIQVTALTGCASVLLGMGARTIHSWSGIRLAKGPSAKIIEDSVKNRNIRKNWLSTDILVIDEVSMMSHKIFNILDNIGRAIRRSSQPFGGIQVIFCGDFYQLGPIGELREPETSEYCFESNQWFEVFPIENHIQLSKIFRQKDEKYIEILNEIRKGELSEENIKILKNYVKRPYNEEEHNQCYLTKLFPIKSRVDYINSKMFEKIEEPVREYNMVTLSNLIVYMENGKPIPEEKIELCRTLTAVEREKEYEKLLSSSNLQRDLQLKKGSAVMCLSNIKIENGICNGSQGTILDFVGNHPKVKFANGMIEIIPIHYIQSEEYPCLAIGQYPLCLAWALTIHKMQGATLDMAQLDIGNAIFEYGQTYVGLSRIRSLDGLYLSEFNPQRIRINPKVRDFYKTIHPISPTANP